MRRRGRAAPGPGLAPFERRVASQNGEDGVIAEILRRIGPGERPSFVEFGAGEGVQATCVTLADDQAWPGLFLESDPVAHAALEAKYAGHPRVRTARASVSPSNVVALFAEHGVPEEPTVLSIDIDGRDLWVWRALAGHHRPRLAVVEYNAGLGFHRALTVPPDHDEPWDTTDYFGASLPALERVAADVQMRLVHTDTTGVNAFFVRDELAHDLPASDDVVRHPPNYLGAGLRHPPDPRKRPWHEL